MGFIMIVALRILRIIAGLGMLFGLFVAFAGTLEYSSTYGALIFAICGLTSWWTHYRIKVEVIKQGTKRGREAY